MMVYVLNMMNTIERFCESKLSLAPMLVRDYVCCQVDMMDWNRIGAVRDILDRQRAYRQKSWALFMQNMPSVGLFDHVP